MIARSVSDGSGRNKNLSYGVWARRITARECQTGYWFKWDVLRRPVITHRLTLSHPDRSLTLPAIIKWKTAVFGSPPFHPVRDETAQAAWIVPQPLRG